MSDPSLPPPPPFPHMGLYLVRSEIYISFKSDIYRNDSNKHPGRLIEFFDFLSGRLFLIKFGEDRKDSLKNKQVKAWKPPLYTQFLHNQIAIEPTARYL